MSDKKIIRIGIDAGGTFTDFVVLRDDGSLEAFKLRSNPRAPAQVIMEGLRQAEGAHAQAKTNAHAGRRRAADRIDVVHGSTVATNALLERKGARTAFVTTAGFEDLLEIGRQNRAELYNLTPAPRKLLVDRSLCFGVRERAYFDGTIALRPTSAEMKRLAARLKRAGVKSVAICFLHAYQNPANERAVARAFARTLRPEDFTLCCSHEICPEFREYERASTTFVNAYVRPLMEAYLEQLGKEQTKAGRYRISIMQSNGGFLSAKEASRNAVRTVLSGPAGGVIGALHSAARSGFRRVLGFDMGGTSTDVSLVDGAPRETTEAIIDGLPIRVPMLDIHTVGAGGGSIARVDAGGLLRVGPESAGADPGPACYGSGINPTVTDAHVVLGRIGAQQLLGGAMILDPERAARAIDLIAHKLNLPNSKAARGRQSARTSAAAGVIRVANANMERAIRAVSVERGHDPRDFALVAFGGSGGLHACEIAAELGMRTVIVPVDAGALSAWGMLSADEVRDYSSGVSAHENQLEDRFAALERRARRDLPAATMERSADLRYLGQSYELNVTPAGEDRKKRNWSIAEAVVRAFHSEHARIYGYATPERAVEIVTVRVRARVIRKTVRSASSASHKTAHEMSHEISNVTRRIWVGSKWMQTPVWQRSQLCVDPPALKSKSEFQARLGPALILDYGSTTWVPQGWSYQVDHTGNLILRSIKSS